MARDPGYRRVVVAIDSSRSSSAALDASAGLASGLGAELAGLFIEDVNQLRLGALPFTRLVGPGPVSRDVDVGTIERSMRRAAAAARARLERLAQARPQPVPWSFRVVRGAIARELGAAAEPADLIVVEERALGRIARAALASANASVLCLCAGGVGANEVIVVFGDSEPEQRALDAALRVARATGRTLTVLVADAAQETKLAEAIDAKDVPVQAVRAADPKRDFAQVVARRPGAIVVWTGTDEESETRRALEPLLESGRFSMLVVR
jgi:nucleotide-binding universal stress UspA family protein